MGVSTIQPGTVSGPHVIAPGVLVTVSPAVGASAYVEYTTNTLADIQNGVAVWLPWPKGVVSSQAACVASKAAYVRVTATGGAVVLQTNFAPNNQDLAQFRNDWALNSPVILAQSGVSSSVTGTTAETVLATIPIPAGMLSANGVIRIGATYGFTGGAGTHTMTMRLGGSQVATNAGAATVLAAEWQRIVRAANSQNAQAFTQVGTFGSGTAAAGPGSTSVNMANAQNLTLTATLGSSADTATLVGYTVEILNP